MGGEINNTDNVFKLRIKHYFILTKNTGDIEACISIHTYAHIYTVQMKLYHLWQKCSLQDYPTKAPVKSWDISLPVIHHGGPRDSQNNIGHCHYPWLSSRT